LRLKTLIHFSFGLHSSFDVYLGVDFGQVWLGFLDVPFELGDLSCRPLLGCGVVVGDFSIKLLVIL
jgi:hypothetical protein